MRTVKLDITVYHKHCQGCGVAFDTNKTHQKYCSAKCYLKHKHKNPKLNRMPRAVPFPTKTFDEIISEIERYNQENKTRLTYGQWVAKGGSLTR